MSAPDRNDVAGLFVAAHKAIAHAGLPPLHGDAVFAVAMALRTHGDEIGPTTVITIAIESDPVLKRIMAEVRRSSK